MFSLIIIVLALILISVLRSRSTKSDEVEFLFIYVLVMIFLVSVLVNFTAYDSQLNDVESILQIENTTAIYEKKSKELTTEFSMLLAQTYPEYEKEIFRNMTPDNIEVFLVRYPEIRSSETLIELVKQINPLKSDIYNQKIKKEEVLKRIRVRLRNPWFFRSLLPKKLEG